MPKYVALVTKEASRIQVCTVDPAGETAHSHWMARPGMEAYLGIVGADGPETAKAEIARSAGLPEDNVRVVPVPET